jgi:hypothetical protein
MYPGWVKGEAANADFDKDVERETR